MNMFQVRDGLFHYVFANLNDVCVTDSTLKLSLRQWLCRELRRECGRVLFFEGTGRDYYLRAYNRASWQFFAEQCKGFLGISLRGRADYQPERAGEPVSCTADQIQKMTAQASDTALVFRLDTFADVFAGREMDVYDLIRENPQKKNLILLVSSVFAADSMSCFQDPRGIFQAATGRGFLFPEIVQAFCEPDERREGCYRRLRRLTGNACVFLNRFSEEQVRNAVLLAAWKRDPGWERIKEETIDAVADFVYVWYHASSVQMHWQGLFQDNARREISVLLRDLENNWSAAAEAAAVYREESSLSGRPPLDIREPCVVAENMFIRQLRQISIPEYSASEDGGRGSSVYYRKRLQALIRDMQVPCGGTPDVGTQKLLLRVTDRMSLAVQLQDTQTFDYCVSALRYAAEHRYCAGDKERLCLRTYEQMTDVSDDLFAKVKEIYEREKRLHRKQEELKKLVSDIEAGHYRDVMEKHRAMEKAGRLDRAAKAEQALLEKAASDESSLGRVLQELDIMLQASDRTEAVSPELGGLIRQLQAQTEQSREAPLRDLLDSVF